MATEQDYQAFLDRVAALEETVADRLSSRLVTDPQLADVLVKQIDDLLQKAVDADMAVPPPPDKGLAQLVGVGPEAASALGQTRIPQAITPKNGSPVRSRWGWPSARRIAGCCRGTAPRYPSAAASASGGRRYHVGRCRLPRAPGEREAGSRRRTGAGHEIGAGRRLASPTAAGDGCGRPGPPLRPVSPGCHPATSYHAAWLPDDQCRSQARHRYERLRGLAGPQARAHRPSRRRNLAGPGSPGGHRCLGGQAGMPYSAGLWPLRRPAPRTATRLGHRPVPCGASRRLSLRAWRKRRQRPAHGPPRGH
jgi:hypothetical protein